MKIYKYITEVKHHGAGGDEIRVGDRSGNKTLDWKEQNSVKIEAGDYVVYTIDIVNSSRFTTMVQVEDILPANFTNLHIYDRFKYVGESGASHPANWISVPAGGKVTVQVSFDALADRGTHKNTVQFITTNYGAIHMRWASGGNIVNEDESRIKDSDYYTIKEYDVSVDKYITEVKHSTNGVVTFNNAGERKNKDLEWKKNNFAHVERGDVVTYTIDIYNTKDPYIVNGNRNQAPYWDPDLAYVDITDVLPKKYSQLNVEVSNKTGKVTTTNGGFKVENIKVPKNGITTVKVSIVAEEISANVLEENKIQVINVRSINNKKVVNNSVRSTDSDFYRVKEYDVSVDKYITEVKHLTNGVVTFSSADERKDKTVEWKKNNFAHVERGDIVTYTIDIYNTINPYLNVGAKDRNQAPYWDPDLAYVDITDVLPKKYDRDKVSVSVSNGTGTIEIYDGGFKVNNIEVPKSGITTVKVSIVADEISAKVLEENNVKIVPDVRNVNNRSIINHSKRLTDSDFYRVKEYDLTLDKYITEVKHETNGVVTYSGTERKQIDNEEIKKNDPVYAEYGDVVTYKIDIYNTKEPYLNAGVKNRNEEPFWDPDLAYVDVTDTLPKKYSKLTVVVSNGTGNITTNNGGFKVENIEVPKNGITTITVTIVVEEHVRETLEENNIKITIPSTGVRNVNNREIINHSAKISTSDWYKINDYNLTIDKYISDYKHEMTDFNNNNQLTQETNILADRYEMSEDEKKNAPLQVEKTETIVYSIRLTNEAVEQGKKRATQVRPTKIQDAMDAGLEYQSVVANIYNSSGEVKLADIPVTHTELGNNVHAFEIPNKKGEDYVILDPTDYIIYEVTVKVTKTNMYLFSLENTASYLILTNINHDESSREIKNDDYNENIADEQESKEYVKLKDLVIAGKVWLDRDKDGYMGKNGNGSLEVGGNAINVEANPSTHVGDTTDKEYAMQGIIVKLYKDDGTLLRTTKTDNTGLFTFSRLEDGSTYRAGIYSASGSGVIESEQRIEKATNKDENKNYTEASELINYYIEYEYDGLVYKSTEIYSDNKNIGIEGEIDDKYKRDSNAYEFTDVREDFNKHYEIIAFNKAYNGDLSESSTLEYEKKDHESFIRGDKDRKITARSFINVPSTTSIENTKLLWLLKQTGSDYKPETEYLKYINLGLEEREKVDLDITQDVYEVKTAINGEEMLYEYNQNIFTTKVGEVASDGSGSSSKGIDKERSTNEYDSEFYKTKKKYTFEYYLEDYNYRISQYESDTVRKYKGSPDRDFNANATNGGASVLLDNSVGRESELNTEITFRIKVTNNKITDDEPHKDNSDIKVYAGINEIVEYYDADFVDFTAGGNFNIKTKDENGYLVNKEVKVLTAKAIMKDGQEKPVTLSKDSPYNATRTLTNNEGKKAYNTLYIRPAVENTSTNTLTGKGIKASEFILAEGESMDILVTLVVEKEADGKEIKTILGDKKNVVEISSYSTYYNDGGNYKSASLVDRNSNPGNFGEAYGGVSNVDDGGYFKYYEDDTFETVINLKVPSKPDNPPDNPPDTPPDEENRDKNNVQRTLKGYVWDDARSEIATNQDGTQYIGNGKYGDGVSALPEARKNKAFEQSDGSNREDNDFGAKDVKAQLIETIRIPDLDGAGTERVYEETIYANGETGNNASVMKARTSDSGEYVLSGYIPGEYIVRFIYGDKDAGEDGNSVPEERLIFNGQDYKSTTYQANESVFVEHTQGSGNKATSDAKLEVLEKPGQSDAKDDEIRRLEVIGYSETITNPKNEILKGKYSSDKNALLENTYMNAETTDFLVRAEKELKEVTVLTYNQYNKKITETFTKSRFNIANIDFGLQYRPEQQLALNKFISNITVLTSDINATNANEPLIKAVFDEYYGVVRHTDLVTGATTFVTDGSGNIIKVNPNGSNADIENAVATAGGDIGNAQKNNDGTYVIAVAGTELNIDKSTGLQNVQYLPSLYEKDSNGIQAIEEYPTGSGKYLVKAVQGFAYIVLDDDILQGSTIKIKYLLTATNISETDRVTSKLSNLRFRENAETGTYGSIGETPEQKYSPALTARNKLFNELYRYDNDILYRVKPKDFVVNGRVVTPEGETGYYGRYLGSTYYTGLINEDTEVISEIKVDKIIDYIDNDLVFNTDENRDKDGTWKTTTAKELYEENMLNKSVYTYYDENEKPVNGITSNYKIIDADGRAYNTNERSNLAISIDDRVRDDIPDDQDTTTKNKKLSKFLFPRYSNSDKSIGMISIATSKVLSPEDKTDDMTYENIAEIIQYTTVNGRVTNLATTIGNAKVEEIPSESPEFHEGRTESDTASVERITLTPPTGLDKLHRVVRTVVEGASYTVVVIIIVIVVCVAVTIGIVFYRKKRIK